MKNILNQAFQNVQLFTRQIEYEREMSRQRKFEAQKARAEAEKAKAEVTRWQQKMFRHQLECTNYLNAYIAYLQSSKLVKYSKDDSPTVFGYNVSMNKLMLADGQISYVPFIRYLDTFFTNGRFWLEIAIDGKVREDTCDVFRNVVKTHFDSREMPFGTGKVEVRYDRDILRNVVVLELIPKKLAQEFQRISRV